MRRLLHEPADEKFARADDNKLLPRVLFVGGIVGVGEFPGLYATFPVGATLYGRFLISRILEKEVVAFDAEQRAQGGHPRTDNHSESVEPLHGHEDHEPMRA